MSASPQHRDDEKEEVSDPVRQPSAPSRLYPVTAANLSESKKQQHSHQKATAAATAHQQQQQQQTPAEPQQQSQHPVTDDDMQGHPAQQEQGSLYETDVKEQDRWLPIANVARIMKTALPDNAKIAKEAKECMQECVSEFISFITSEASEKCQQEKRKTVNGEDIIFAMTSLGFENYSEALRIYLVRYRETNIQKNEGQQGAPGPGGRPTSGYGQPGEGGAAAGEGEGLDQAAVDGSAQRQAGFHDGDGGGAFAYPGSVVQNGGASHY